MLLRSERAGHKAFDSGMYFHAYLIPSIEGPDSGAAFSPGLPLFFLTSGLNPGLTI